MSRHVTTILLSLAGAFGLFVAGNAQDLVRAPDFIVLHGVVTSEESTDTPLRSVRVAVTWTDGETEPVFTDDRGRFSVAIRRAVYHTITATKAGYSPLRVGREPDSRDEPVVFRMSKGAVITGSVIDATGAPVPGANIRVRRTDPSGRTYGSGDYQTDTDDRGEFRVGSLPAGRYAVVLEAAGPRPVLGDAVQPDSVVDVPAGGERAVLRIDPRAPVGGAGATSYAAGFNAAAAAAAAAPRTGTSTMGSVQGRVLDALGRPLPGILIRAFDVRGGTGPVGASDAAGRFAIGNLAPGTYRIVASRTSMATTLATQSAADGTVVAMRTLRVPMDGPGQIVVIGPGEQLAGVDLTLLPGGVVTGHVVDAAGEPLEGITVQAWTRRRAGGRTILEPAIVGPFIGSSGRKTDDRGQFRLFDLPPGTYYLAAVERTPDLDNTSGRLVFHPSAVSPAMAVPIAVQQGLEAFASIGFASGPLSTVEGQAFDESGEPFHGTVRLVARARNGAQLAMSREMLVRDGTFRFADVPPGEYVVQAIARIINGIRLAAIGESGLRFGVAFVSTAADAAASAVVQTGTGSVLRGRVVVEGGSGPALPMPMSVSALPADPELSPAGELRRARVQLDGSFEILGLFGPMRFAADLPAGWRLESVYIDGSNAADDPVTFGSARQSRAGVEVVITRGGAEIAGRVSGEDVARAGALVVAGPGNPAQWHAGSRFVRMTTADREGRFTLSGLPAGHFLVTAIDAATLRPGSGESFSSDDISFMMSGATNVSVAADGRASVNVRVTQLTD